MFRNNLKIALRNFSKRRLHSFINVLGLSMAFTFCMLVFLYARFEFGRDGFHVNAGNIYSVNTVNYLVDNASVESHWSDLEVSADVEKSAYHPALLGPELSERIPEITRYSRYGFGSVNVQVDNQEFSEKVKYVDPVFLQLFSFPVLRGDHATALDRPDKVAISMVMAQKYFGSDDPIGQVLNIDEKSNKVFEVGAVFEVPAGSSLTFDMLMRYEQNYYYQKHKENWNYTHTPLFLELSPEANLDEVQVKMNEFYQEKYARRIKRERESRKLSEDSPVNEYSLVNLRDIYFNKAAPIDASSLPVYTLMLLGVALIILIIACINYVSISVAAAASRATEVGIRKTIGASRKQLKSQFYIEVLLLTTLAGLFSFTGAQMLLPWFNEMTGVNIVMQQSELIMLTLFSLGSVLVVSLIASIYPALFITRFEIMKSLNGRSTSQINPRFIKPLVVFQFVMCVFFISMSATMHQQFRYISEKDLGYESESVLVMKGTNGLTSKLRAALTSSPYINGVTGATGIFSEQQYSSSFIQDDIMYQPRTVFTDTEFIQTMEIELVSGRDLSNEFGGDLNQKNCLINELYYNILKKDSTYDGSVYGMKVVGVMKDFHFDELLREIEPIYLKASKDGTHTELFVNFDLNHTEEVIDHIKASWSEVASTLTLDYSFMDAILADQYKKQRRWNNIINASAISGILIACIGLFGLSGIEASNRTKEIGIRKVLGANLGAILTILNKKTLWLISAAILIAFPVSYYVMNAWLDTFAYKISVNADIFLISGAICLLIVLLTSSYHSVKTAHINPIKLLRDE